MRLQTILIKRNIPTVIALATARFCCCYTKQGPNESQI